MSNQKTDSSQDCGDETVEFEEELEQHWQSALTILREEGENVEKLLEEAGAYLSKIISFASGKGESLPLTEMTEDLKAAGVNIGKMISKTQSILATYEKEDKIERGTIDYEKFQGPEGDTQIPISAHAWQLYSDMDGVEEVGKRLTAALKKAITAENKEQAIWIMSKALDKYTDFGASDSEPRAVAERCLTEARGSNYSWTL